jgi:hypothetical protein
MNINPEDYYEDLLLINDIVYKDSDVNYIAMGKNLSKIKPFINDKTSKLCVHSPIFNYSFSNNIILNYLSETLQQDVPVILTDSHIYFSISRVLKTEFPNVDFSKNFITVDIVNNINSVVGSLNIKDKIRPQILIEKRIKEILEMKKVPYNVPAIICSLSILINNINGLNEEFFTNLSRFQLIKQLKLFGLTELKSTNLGICFKPGSMNDLKRKEMSLIEKMEEEDNKSYKNNINIAKIGDINRISELLKKDERQREKKIVVEPKKPDEEIKITKIKTKVTSRPKPEKNIIIPKNKNKGGKVLLLINNTIQDIIESTGLIQKIYNKESIPVDIMTNNKFGINLDLIRGEMVDRVFDTTDLANKFIPFTKYSMIIRTINCNIRVPSMIKTLDCQKQKDKTQFEINLSILEDEEKEYSAFLPYCSSEYYKYRIPQDSICFGVSKKMTSKCPMWDKFNILIGKLSNLKKNINIIGLTTEHQIIDYSVFKYRKNCIVEEKLSCRMASSIIKESNIFITSTSSDLSWIGYASNKKMFLIDHIPSEIPDLHWIDKILVDEKNINFVDEIVNKILTSEQ